MARNTYVKRPSWEQRTNRRKQAALRTDARNKRTDAQQLAVLDTRPGDSKRERKRLGIDN